MFFYSYFRRSILFSLCFLLLLQPTPIRALKDQSCPDIWDIDFMKSTATGYPQAQRLAELALKQIRDMPNPRNYPAAGLLALRSLKIKYSFAADAILQHVLVCLSPAGLFQRRVGFRSVAYAFFPELQGPHGFAEVAGTNYGGISSSGYGGNFAAHTDAILSLKIDQVNNVWLTGSADHTARLWYWKPEDHSRVLIGHTDAVTSVAFSPDGEFALTGSADRTVRIWNTKTGQEVGRFTGHAAPVTNVEFSPDGNFVLSADEDGALFWWEARTYRVIRRFVGHAGLITSIAIHPSGKSFFSAGTDETLRQWDIETGGEIRRLLGHYRSVTSLAIVPGGFVLVSASWDGTIREWNTASGHEIRRYEIHEPIIAIAVSGVGEYIGVIHASGSATQIDRRTGDHYRLQYMFGEGDAGKIVSLGYAEGGKKIAVSYAEGTSWQWDANTGEITGSSIHLDSKGIAVRTMTYSDGTATALSPDRHLLLVAVRGMSSWSPARHAFIQNTATGNIVRQFVSPEWKVSGVTFSADGRHILIGSRGMIFQHLVDLSDAMAEACRLIGRDFTAEERATFGITDTTPTCNK
jgi:WD40 repeat protein